MGKTTTVLPPNAIAIVGMACRFPGAPNLEQFWQNLRNGVECVTFFSDRELLDAGVDPDLLANPHYVKARAILEDIDRFDARFFELTPREAEITDPQHRLFLECAWEALERAAYEANSFSGRIGLFAGVSASSYTLNNLYLNPTFIQSVGDIQTGIRLAGLGSDKDFLTTRVSYKLNLTGPSVDVQSACSTSLVAIHLACQSLLSFQSDMVLAGGASIQVPQQAGYLHQDGGVLSPDGHCRAFDARARGTIPGSGVGVVVLKRLEEALEDGDRVLAVIRSSAMNNDGSSKVGFTAPSVEGQAETIAEALSLAEVSPKTIGYVETHGTGTALGDPIEVAALTQAFRTGTDRTGFCAIGSVKPSIGHLDAAAGVAGLIEAVLALQHRQIPPSLNFEQPNPQINFAKSPFFVADRLIDWPRQDWPRRAGVSSFGIGGTNVHAVLEEAPECEMSGSSRPWQLLLLSAKTPTALDRATRNLATCLRQEPTLNLADVAYTLQVGRKGFDYRRALMCQTVNDAVMALDPLDPQRVLTQSCEGSPRTVVFMFPGQGSQYTNMGRDLYESETLFRQEVDRCCDLLLPHLGLDLRTVLYPQEPVAAQAKSLKDTALAQPALFVLEYALAKLWMQWGIRPQALMGHSLGEIVAACIAGVFELEDALALVAQRGRLMQSCPAGAMLSVQLPEDKLQSWLTSSLTLAVRNAPDLWVVSGVPEEVDRLETQLTQAGVTCRRLHVSHGFHSPLMASVREPLLEQLRTLKLKEPQIPFLSNLTGTWITPQEATKPDYWAKLLEHPVHFTETCAEILSDPHRSYLEVGPGRTLGTLLERHTEETVGVIPSLRHPQEEGSDVAFVLSSLSRLWLSGISLDWQAFSAHESRQRLLLPTYPFERERYWIESSQPQQRAPDVDVWPSLIDAVRSQGSTGWQATLNTPEHREAQRILNQLCVAYMKEGLQEIGAFGQQNEYLSVADISQRGAIAPRYHQLMHRWVEVLASAGYVERDGERFCKSSKHSVEIQELLTQAQELCSTRPLMVERVRLCGENLATVLRGEQEPLTVFLPLSEKANQQPDPELPLYSKLKESVRSAIDSIVQSTPTKQLRILEIGAGQGSVTREVLPLLPAERTRYCFTDVGGFFLRLAEQRFSDYPFMSFQLLDIDESPQEQGFSSHNFDIAIAVNVLHVTRNLRKTLAHVKSVLASGGVLILLEITQAEPEFDLTDGLLMNPLEDEDRSYGNPFWTVDTWQEELQAQGFSAVEAIPNTSDSGHHVILARGPETSSTPSAFCLATTGAQSRELELDRLAKKTDIADWFYLPSWKRSLPPQPSIKQRRWLLFLDDLDVGAKLARRLQQDQQRIATVVKGDRFSLLSVPENNGSSQLVYALNPQEPADYRALLSDLQQRNCLPERIVHLWSLTQTSSFLSIDLNSRLPEGYASLLRLTAALDELDSCAAEIVVISTGLQDVSGTEIIQPDKAPILAACRVIPMEYETLTCRSIDILPPAAEMDSTVDLLEREIQAETAESAIAYRGSCRWLQSFDPVRLDSSNDSLLRPQGVYLITGGLGAVGTVLAEDLARSQQAKLILVSRTELPPRETWDVDNHPEAIQHKIQQIQHLESLGAEVWVTSADVTDREQMHDVVRKGRARFGTIHGVIHAAVTLNKQLIRDSEAALDLSTSAKVQGAVVLDRIFKDADLDFLLICSSQAAYLGGLRMVTYAAENVFLDAFAHHRTHHQHAYTLSVNWDRWTRPEQEEDSSDSRPPNLPAELRSGMTPEEGIEVFHRVLSQHLPSQIVISTQAWLALIDRTSTNLKSSLQALPEEWLQSQLPQTTHPRPELPTVYVAPRDEIEQALAELWQQVLGVTPVGIHDNFFDLGGDSLTATILVSQASKQFEIDVPARSFFQAPTVAGSAEIILDYLSEGNDDLMAAALAEIEGLSDEEVERELAQSEPREDVK